MLDKKEGVAATGMHPTSVCPYRAAQKQKNDCCHKKIIAVCLGCMASIQFRCTLPYKEIHKFMIVGV